MSPLSGSSVNPPRSLIKRDTSLVGSEMSPIVRATAGQLATQAALWLYAVATEIALPHHSHLGLGVPIGFERRRALVAIVIETLRDEVAVGVGQAIMQLRQPTHWLGSMSTMPLSSQTKLAPVGQTFTQGGSLQWLQLTGRELG